MNNLSTGTYYWQVRARRARWRTAGVWWSFTVPVHLNKLSREMGRRGWAATSPGRGDELPDSGYWVCVERPTADVCDSMWWPTGGYAWRTYEGLAPGTYYWEVLADTPAGRVRPTAGRGGTSRWRGGAGGPLVAGDESLLWPTSGGGRPLPANCASDGTTVWCGVRTHFDEGRYRLRFHGVPGLAIWVDGLQRVSPVAVARQGVTNVAVDLSAGDHAIQWQYAALALGTTVTPAPTWKREGSRGGPHDRPTGPAIPTSDPPISTDTSTRTSPLVLLEPEGLVVAHYHLDALGSVRAVTNAQGGVLARHDFLPFGEELAPQNPPEDRKLFTGQERDFETGIDYFNARMLRPDLGRFLTPDPLSALPGYAGAQDLSPYTYVQNNPTGFVNPTGLWSVGISIGPYGASWSGTGFGGLGGSGLQLGSWGSFVPAFSFSASFGGSADATTGTAGGQGTGPAATALESGLCADGWRGWPVDGRDGEPDFGGRKSCSHHGVLRPLSGWRRHRGRRGDTGIGRACSRQCDYSRRRVRPDNNRCAEGALGDCDDPLHG